MPACITSLLRELVPVPKLGADSMTKTSLPYFTESSLATAMPTIPAPITTQSTVSFGTDSTCLHDDDMVLVGYFLPETLSGNWSVIELNLKIKFWAMDLILFLSNIFPWNLVFFSSNVGISLPRKKKKGKRAKI